jgi:hypothetical protein
MPIPIKIISLYGGPIPIKVAAEIPWLKIVSGIVIVGILVVIYHLNKSEIDGVSSE